MLNAKSSAQYGVHYMEPTIERSGNDIYRIVFVEGAEKMKAIKKITKNYEFRNLNKMMKLNDFVEMIEFLNYDLDSFGLRRTNISFALREKQSKGENQSATTQDTVLSGNKVRYVALYLPHLRRFTLVLLIKTFRSLTNAMMADSCIRSEEVLCRFHFRDMQIECVWQLVVYDTENFSCYFICYR